MENSFLNKKFDIPESRFKEVLNTISRKPCPGNCK